MLTYKSYSQTKIGPLEADKNRVGLACLGCYRKHKSSKRLKVVPRTVICINYLLRTTGIAALTSWIPTI